MARRVSYSETPVMTGTRPSTTSTMAEKLKSLSFSIPFCSIRGCVTAGISFS